MEGCRGVSNPRKRRIVVSGRRWGEGKGDVGGKVEKKWSEAKKRMNGESDPGERE